MTSMDEPVLIFDLDGTIIDVNSFPLWAGDMLRGRVPSIDRAGRTAIALRTAAALARRKLLREPHDTFKARLQRIWTRATERAATDLSVDLVARLASHVRPNLDLILRDVASGTVDAVLTTAAAAEYALPLARHLGFRHAIATPTAGSADCTENVGSTKRDRTLAYLVAQGWADRPRIFFTDHRDDLPLIRECQTIVWLGPDAECASVCGAVEGITTIVARPLAANVLHGHAVDKRSQGSVVAFDGRSRIRACT